jgi:2-oxoglutarate ferredoxin oxidoreductase subunit alpha
MHRVGGIEKQDGTGNISYDPENHHQMTLLRDAKVKGIAKDIPGVNLDDPTGEADTLVLSWGGTWGAATAAVRRIRAQNKQVAHIHLRHLNPFPADLGATLQRYPKVFVPELNLGQLSKLIRAEFLVDATSYNRVAGIPFRAAELEQQILELMDK